MSLPTKKKIVYGETRCICANSHFPVSIKVNIWNQCGISWQVKCLKFKRGQEKGGRKRPWISKFVLRSQKYIYTPPLPPPSLFLLVNNTPFQCMKMKWNYVNCWCRIHRFKNLEKMHIFSELMIHELEIHCFLRPDSRFSWYLGWVWF